MREVHICRADGFTKDDVVEPVVIRIERDAPAISYSDPDFAKKTAARFTAEGTALGEAIWSACSGGTVDALIAVLLASRASTFRVRLPQEKTDA